MELSPIADDLREFTKRRFSDLAITTGLPGSRTKEYHSRLTPVVIMDKLKT